MTFIALLFVVGALLLTAEVFLPGGIAGAIGALALVAGSGLAFNQFGLVGGVLTSVAAFLLVAGMLYFEWVVLPKTKWGRAMVVQATVAATSQPPLARADDVVGQTAVALTPLAPSGFVEVAGRRYEAFCRSGYAQKAATLQVVGIDNFRLIVVIST